MTTGLSHVAYRDQGERHGNDFFGTPTLPCGFETDCDPAPHRTPALGVAELRDDEPLGFVSKNPFSGWNFREIGSRTPASTDTEKNAATIKPNTATLALRIILFSWERKETSLFRWSPKTLENSFRKTFHIQELASDVPKGRTQIAKELHRTTASRNPHANERDQAPKEIRTKPRGTKNQLFHREFTQNVTTPSDRITPLLLTQSHRR
jgi:hypothetical protein